MSDQIPPPSSSSSSRAPCAACKTRREKCIPDCIFAPYFPAESPERFVNVHSVFGAANVGKILGEVRPVDRQFAADGLVYEAEQRIKDPINGCVGKICMLQREKNHLLTQLKNVMRELREYKEAREQQRFHPAAEWTRRR